MDKNFNDQELSDIMKEIEALEEEFVADTKSTLTVAPTPAPAAPVAASPILEELAEMKEEVSIPAAKPTPIKAAPAPAKRPAPVAHSSTGTSMSFKVSGDLKLDLSFDVGGKYVALQVHEHGLTIEMDGGATFTIPLNKAA